MNELKRDMHNAKQILLERKRDHEEKLEQMGNTQFSDGQVQDPGDQALTSTMELLHGSMQEAEISDYKRINKALEKIEDGTYGICVDCGNEILDKRLKSYPDAERCLVCQEEYEDLKANE